MGNFNKSLEDYNLAIKKDSKQYLKSSIKNLDKVLDFQTVPQEYNTCPTTIMNV